MSFLDYPRKHDYIKDDGSYYSDYVCHTKLYKEMWVSGSKVSTAHECTHGTNSEIRNAGYRDFFHAKLGDHSPAPGVCCLIQPLPRKITGDQTNGFYLGKNKAITVKEPKCYKSDAISFIPQALRGYRFSTYISGQVAWNSQPLYVFDEFVCYSAGLDTALDMAKAGDNSEKNTDWIFGVVEFIGYGLGVLLAIEKHDNDAFTRDPNLLEFMKFQFKRAFNQYFAGKDVYPWADADKFYKILKDGAEAKEMRRIMQEKLAMSVPVGPDEGELDRDLFDLFGD